MGGTCCGAGTQSPSRVARPTSRTHDCWKHVAMWNAISQPNWVQQKNCIHQTVKVGVGVGYFSSDVSYVLGFEENFPHGHSRIHRPFHHPIMRGNKLSRKEIDGCNRAQLCIPVLSAGESWNISLGRKRPMFTERLTSRSNDATSSSSSVPLFSFLSFLSHYEVHARSRMPICSRGVAPAP